MKQGSRALVAALVSLVMAGSGCSMAFQSSGPAKPGSVGQLSDCSSTSYLYPIIDSILLGAEVAAGTYFAAKNVNSSNDNYAVLAGSTLLVGVWQMGSAVDGFRRSSECGKSAPSTAQASR